jgi:hypothetical protein
MNGVLQFRPGWAALALFLTFFVAVPEARAWNEDTHQNIVQLSYQVANLIDYEKNRRPEPSNIATSIVLGILDDRAPGASEAEWNDFVAVVAASRGRLGELVIGSEGENLDEHDGNILCAPPTAKRLKTIDEFPFGSIATNAKNFNSDPTPVPPCQKVKASDYRFGGIYDNPLLVLASGSGPHTGSMLGWLSAGVDSRINDWYPVVVPIDFLVNTLSAAFNGGNPDSTAADVGATVTIFVAILALFLLAAVLFGPIGVVLTAALVSALAIEYHVPGFIVNPRDFVGSGHYINVQTPVAFGSKRIPSNKFDDVQGKDLTQAFLLRGTSSDNAVQDSFDHYVLDKGGLGAGVDFEDSFGTKHYQITDPDDGSAPSDPFRGEDYWDERDFSEVVFPPVDNLGYYGWRKWRQDSCKKVERLHWPLHALGDASAPHHVVGATGLGHRPFEDIVQYSTGGSDKPPPGPKAFSGQWEDIIFAKDETKGKEQARRIFKKAFTFAKVIRDFQRTHPGDIPFRQLVTLVANETLRLVNAPDAPKISCTPNACHLGSSLPDANGGFDGTGIGGPNATLQTVSLICDGTCTGLTVKPTCDVLFGKEATACTVNEYIALELSGISGSMPAVLPPGLSHYYDGHFTNEGRAYYRKQQLIDEQRKFVELGASATLAFLAYAAEIASTPVSDSACLCVAPSVTCSGACVDLTTDQNNCGSCGNVCAAGSTCCNGTCSDLQRDSLHCGRCDRMCGFAERCQSGVCACPNSGEFDCAGTCRNILTDRNNCGGCGLICELPGPCVNGFCPVEGPF